jgi:hypothetical protein
MSYEDNYYEGCSRINPLDIVFLIIFLVSIVICGIKAEERIHNNEIIKREMWGQHD